MRFLILGPLEVESDSGVPIEVTAPRSTALLTMLLLARGDVVSSDRIVDGLWPSLPSASQSRALRFQIWKLRRVLEPKRDSVTKGSVIRTVANGYRIEGHFVDEAAFEDRVTEARSFLPASPDLALDRLQCGLALWRGEPLGYVQYDDFAQPAIRRLAALRIEAEILRVNVLITMNRNSDALFELERLTANHATVERFWSQLMTVLCLEGRQAEALAVYSEAMQVLSRELGSVESPTLKHVRDRVRTFKPGQAKAMKLLAVAPNQY